jgi:hypothetical protein
MFKNKLHSGMFKNQLLLRKALIALLVFTGGYNAFACDVCGCSVGGSYFGILPQFQKNFIGVRYQQRSFDSEHLTLFPGEVPLNTRETFHTTELWGRYVPHKNLQLFAFVPYNYYTKDEEGIHSVTSGLGDINLMAHYIIFNTGEDVEKKWKQALQVGTGIKLPTGKSDDIQAHTGLLIPSLQAGTGAFDIPFSLIYTVRHGKWGVNAEANYRLNMANKRDYRFGDRITTSARAFYWLSNQSFSLLPHLGLSYEYGFLDKNKGAEQEYTGNKSLLGGGGLDIYFKRFIFNANTQLPLYQYMAKGQITGGQRWNFGIAFLL